MNKQIEIHLNWLEQLTTEASNENGVNVEDGISGLQSVRAIRNHLEGKTTNQGTAMKTVKDLKTEQIALIESMQSTWLKLGQSFEEYDEAINSDDSMGLYPSNMDFTDELKERFNPWFELVKKRLRVIKWQSFTIQLDDADLTDISIVMAELTKTIGRLNVRGIEMETLHSGTEIVTDGGEC